MTRRLIASKEDNHYIALPGDDLRAEYTDEEEIVHTLIRGTIENWTVIDTADIYEINDEEGLRIGYMIIVGESIDHERRHTEVAEHGENRN